MLRAQVVVPVVFFAIVTPALFPDVGARTKGQPRRSLHLFLSWRRSRQKLVAKSARRGHAHSCIPQWRRPSPRRSRRHSKEYGVKVQLWRALSENVLQRAFDGSARTTAEPGRGGDQRPGSRSAGTRAGGRAVRESLSCRSALLGCSLASRWFSDRANLWVTGYNTAKVKREELPTRLKGRRPVWKGRLSLEATDHDWMYGGWSITWARSAVRNSSASCRPQARNAQGAHPGGTACGGRRAFHLSDHLRGNAESIKAASIDCCRSSRMSVAS